MSNLIWQGLMISVMGIGLTFATLGLLILITILLKRFTRDDVQLPMDGEPGLDKMSGGNVPTRDIEEEIVVAIAVALAHLRSTDVSYGDLGATLQAKPGPWWTAGRTQQHFVNVSKTTHRRN